MGLLFTHDCNTSDNSLWWMKRLDYDLLHFNFKDLQEFIDADLYLVYRGLPLDA